MIFPSFIRLSPATKPVTALGLGPLMIGEKRRGRFGAADGTINGVLQLASVVPARISWQGRRSEISYTHARTHARTYLGIQTWVHTPSIPTSHTHIHTYSEPRTVP